MSQTIYPAIRFRDADAALKFMKDAFGFEEHSVHRNGSGAIAHAEARLGDNLLMFGEIPKPGEEGIDLPVGTASIYLAVPDPDAAYKAALAAGATVVRELDDTDYGSREFVVRDPEGNTWSAGTYAP